MNRKDNIKNYAEDDLLEMLFAHKLEVKEEDKHVQPPLPVQAKAQIINIPVHAPVQVPVQIPIQVPIPIQVQVQPKVVEIKPTATVSMKGVTFNAPKKKAIKTLDMGHLFVVTFSDKSTEIFECSKYGGRENTKLQFS